MAESDNIDSERIPSLFRDNTQTELDIALSNVLSKEDPQRRKQAYEKFLRLKEELTEDEFNNKSYDELYPNKNDPLFAYKLAKKKEFFDTAQEDKQYDPKTRGDELSRTEFELSPHQQFVRNFLSRETPYNSLLLFHGLGTGKTCSAISVSEEMRDYMKQTGNNRRILIVASPNVQVNFRTQLFNSQKLKNVNGLWTLRACTGNKLLREINPMNVKGIPREIVLRQIDKLIRQSYAFMGYQQFGNYIEKLIDRATRNIEDPERARKRKIKIIQKEFSNRMIVIDEVHNIRISEDNTDKRVAQMLLELVNFTENMKLLLLSATPMFNNYQEILWLLNLMNLNDKRSRIRPKDVFTRDGEFVVKDGKNVGKELLLSKSRGYISYVRGENPYTFPYRIFPSAFNPERTFSQISPPTIQMNGKTIERGQLLKHIDVFLTSIGDYQQKGYRYIVSSLEQLFPSFQDIEKGIGYQALSKPLQALNMIYPSEKLDREKGDVSELVGKKGLNRIMRSSSGKTKYEYRDEILERYGRVFQRDQISKYSGKIHSILQNIESTAENLNGDGGEAGIIMIYSEYIDGGCVPVALALEEMGFRRYRGRQSLLKNPGEEIDALTLKTRSEYTGERPFKPATYAMITGDSDLSPAGNNEREVNMSTSLNNIKGQDIRVIILSKAGSEGLDFRFVRQVHILDPWFNMNRIEQIIGRGVRTFSHIQLPFEQRNTQIFLYASMNGDIETADLYVYRLAERKAIQIGKITRLLKENAVDCYLNYPTTSGMTAEELNTEVELTLANGETIPYQIGDKPYTATCDYMETCAYKCLPYMTDTEDIMKSHREMREKLREDINTDTYGEHYILNNTDKLKRMIGRIVGTRYIVDRSILLRELTRERTYPLTQIYAALQQMVEDEQEYITDVNGRNGHLSNIGEYYVFQPVELEQPLLTNEERKRPLDITFNHVSVRLPSAVEPTEAPEVEAEPTMAIQELTKGLLKASMTEELKRSEKDWYKLAAYAIDRLSNEPSKALAKKMNQNIKQQEIPTIPRKILLYYVACHYIETQPMEAQLELFKAPRPNDQTLLVGYSMVQQYIERNRVTSNDGSKHGIFLLDSAEAEHLFIQEENWRESTMVETRQFSQSLLALKVPIEQYNNHVGFISLFKGRDYVFKVKTMNKKRHKGARCDQAVKNVTLRLMNELLADYRGEEKEIYQKSTMSKITSPQICVEQEMLIRYFNQTTEKVWMLTPSLAHLNKIETLYREN